MNERIKQTGLSANITLFGKNLGVMFQPLWWEINIVNDTRIKMINIGPVSVFYEPKAIELFSIEISLG